MHDQQFPIGAQFLAIRTAGDPMALAATLRQTLRAFDPDVVVSRVSDLEARLSGSVAQQRFQAAILSAFAAVALVLAAVGLYGVLIHLVGQRTREFGIRVALGARALDVLRLVLWQAMRLTSIGIAIGIAAAAFAARFLANLIYGVQPDDIRTYVGVALLLTTVAAAACLVPARRATRLDPVEALRREGG